MATIQDLGKVAYFNKGIYNSETTYEINDVVSYNGSSYVSLGNDNLGNLPTNTAFWSIVASKGDKGDTGKAFVIEKTYATIADMVDDYDNMNVDDYVMIQGSIEDEENATLWTKTDTEVSPYKWVYLADFSGASGITGATPNIQIGTVTEGNQPSVTRRAGSTNENPILDFVLKTGATGATGPTGNGISEVAKTSTSGLTDTYTISYTSGNSSTFDVHNGKGISSIAKTTSVGLVDTYTITYNDGTTSTFDITNGEDGSVTQEQLDETNEEVERVNMVYNALPKVSGESTDLSLNNTAECPVYDVELSPSELEQESTTGKNLANISDVNSSISNAYFKEISTDYTLTADTTYTLSLDAQVQLTPFIMSVGCGVSSYSKDILVTQNQTNGRIYITFTPTAEQLENGNKLFIRCPRYASLTSTTFELKNFQLETGSSMTDYEPYTGGQPSPNPQYPQQIHVVSGENSVKISNKNLLNPNIIENGNIDTDTGLPSGTTGNFVRTNDYISVISSQNYTFQYELKVSDITGQIVVYEYDTNKNFINFDNITNFSGSVTLSPTTKYIKLRLKSTSLQITDFKYAQVEYGSNVTSYEPYTYQTYPLSLGDLEYCKIGDYEDLFFKNVVGSEYYDSTLVEDKWYLKKNVGKVVLDGTENWGKQSGMTNFYNLNNFLNAKVLTSYSTGRLVSKHFIENPTGNYIGSNYIWITSNGLSLRVGSVVQTTVEDFKTWLSANNDDLYYQLATSTYTLLNNTLQAELDNLSNAISYNQQTNVSQTNADLPFVIKMSAIRDLSGIFELIQ